VIADALEITRLGQRALYSGDRATARERFAQALRLEPECAAALAGLGDCHALAGEHRQALQKFDEALALDPQDAWIRNNRALSLVAVGRIRESWAESEVRFQLQEKTRKFWERPPRPRWDGAVLPGRLAVLWEQGFGDMLQHLRFLPLAAQRTQGVAFVCPPPLQRLVSASFPSVELLPPGEPIQWQAFSACIALLSLPLVLGVDWPTLPRAPYLTVPGASQPGMRGIASVGIVWRSSAFDPVRNCPLEATLALKACGVQLASLQVGLSDEERATLRAHGIESHAGEDFYATAEAMLPLKAVVSVDTAPAHLAGALGKRTLLLLNEPAAVRWMQELADTPWYPTMRLLRKRASDPWEALISRATTELNGIAA